MSAPFDTSNQSELERKKRASQQATANAIDALLSKATANTQQKKPTITSIDKSGNVTQRDDLYIGITGSKQADLAIGKRQIESGQGVAGKHADEYLKTTEGAGVKSRLFQEGIKVRPHTREGAREAAETVQVAKQQYYNEQNKKSGGLTAGQRDPITGQRITSVRGQRPNEPNANDLSKIIGNNPNLTPNQKEYANNYLGVKSTRGQNPLAQVYGSTIVGGPSQPTNNGYVSTPRGALSDSLKQFIGDQEKDGDTYYTGKARITDEGYEFQFGSRAESKKYRDALKAFNIENYNYRQEKARVDAANAKSEADYQKFLSDAYDQGYRGKLIKITDDGTRTTTFAAFQKDGVNYYPDDNGIFNIPAPKEKENPYTPTQSGQIYAGSVKYLGEIGAGLTVLGGGVVSKAADLLGLKDQAKGVHEATEAAAGAIKEATGFGTLEKFYDNLARVTGNDNYYVESKAAKDAKEALEQKDRPTGSLFGSGIAIAATGFEKAGLPGDKQAAESLRQDQLDSVTNRQTEYGVASAWDVVTFGGAGVLSDIGKSAGNAVKGIGKSASKGFVREAETAASRAGVEGKVTTRPIEQIKIKSTGEIVDVPLQPTKVGNFAWASRLTKIPKIGGKEIKIGIMEDYPIATVKIPEGISSKRLVASPVHEVIDEGGNVVGAVAPKSGKVVIQRQDFIDMSGSGGKKSRSVDVGNLVGQDATKTQDTMAWINKQTDLTSIKEKGTKPFYHSSKIVQRIENFAINHDPTLNLKAKRLKGKLDVEYEKADKLQARKAELQQELSLADQDVNRLSVSDMMGVNSVDTEGLQSAIARKEAASKKLGEIDLQLGQSSEKIRDINAKFGIKRGDAVGAYQHASEFFYRIGGKGRDKQAKGLTGFNAGGVPIPKVKDIPNRTGELRAKGTTDIYRLQENPSLPSSRRSRLEGFNLLRDGEGIDPTGEFFVKKNGAATKLKSDLAAVDIEFGLGDVKKSIRQTDKRNKQIKESNEALSLLGGSSKNSSSPFRFNILDDMPGKAKLRGSSNSIIEVIKTREPETFASVKESVFASEREASLNGLGLGGNAKAYTAIGSLGFGGETGAGRRKKTVTEDSLAYLRYPGEKLDLKEKPTIGLDEFVGRTLLHDSASGGGIAKPKRSVPTFGDLTGLGDKSKQDDKTGLGGLFKNDNKVADAFRFGQQSGLDYSLKLDQLSKQINSPTKPSTFGKTNKPFGLPFLALPGGSFGSSGGKPSGKSSTRQREVFNPFIGHGAFDIGTKGKDVNIFGFKPAKVKKRKRSKSDFFNLGSLI